MFFFTRTSYHAAKGEDAPKGEGRGAGTDPIFLNSGGIIYTHTPFYI